jgi:hypothetical protein
MKGFLIAPAVVFLVISSGCAKLQIDNAIERYEAVRDQVKIGASKDQALSILLPTQETLPAKFRHASDSFTVGDKLVEIIYMRFARTAFVRAPLRNFTPYVFLDGKLIIIGWTAWGPETQPMDIQHIIESKYVKAEK